MTPEEESHRLNLLAGYLAFADDLDDDALLRLIMEVGLGLVQGDEGSLLLVDWDRNELVFQITVGSGDSEQVLKGQRFPLTQGLSGEVAMTGMAQAGAPRYHGVEMDTNQPRAVLAAPIATEDEQTLGVLTAVRFTDGQPFSARDVELYAQFGRICAHLLRQRLREGAVRALLQGKSTETLDPSLQPLAMGPLGMEHALVGEVAAKLAGLAQGSPEALAMASELCDTLVNLARHSAWRDMAD